MQPWFRSDTTRWISQLEKRIDDMQFYLNRTDEWCRDREVYSITALTGCRIITLLWVSHLRQEIISKREVFEIIGVVDWYNAPDDEYMLSEEYGDKDIDELLEIVLSTIN